jgi:hypothetical protein
MSQSKYFMDTLSPVMHAYNAPNPVLRSEHLGLYKAFCVLLEWSYASSPDHEESYQSFSEPEEMANFLYCWSSLQRIPKGLLKGFYHQISPSKKSQEAAKAIGGYQSTIVFISPGYQAIWRAT